MTDEHPDTIPAQHPAPLPNTPAVTPNSAQQDRSGAWASVATAAVIAFVVASFAGLAGGYLGAKMVLDEADGPGVQSAQRVSADPETTTDPVVAAAAAAVPSVVNVDVTGGTASAGKNGLPDTHPNVPNSGTGSGVAFKAAEGGGTYILTNNHVVESAGTITVRDAANESVKATLVGTDAETDIAVLKVAADIPVIDTGDSGMLVVGQTVVAIGSPFGLEHSVTSGVVSALGRSLPDFTDSNDAYPLVDVIQTDASINPGNSGGALVDRSGELVGINTAIYSDSGASGGIGFAIPVNTALRVAGQIIEGGSVSHPFLGVVGQDVDATLADQKKLSVNEGAYVVSVLDGTGAKKAGVKSGDVITALDSDDIRSMDDLLLQVRRHKVGDSVTLTVVRGKETRTLEMTIGDKPEDIQMPSEDTTGAP